MSQASSKVVPIDDLQLDPENLRRRDAETEAMLEASLTEFGAFRSIAVDGELVTRAGNGTLKAAKAAGISEVLVVTPAPGQLVAVQRDDLTASQLARYSIADNRLTDPLTLRPEGPPGHAGGPGRARAGPCPDRFHHGRGRRPGRGRRQG